MTPSCGCPCWLTPGRPGWGTQAFYDVKGSEFPFYQSKSHIQQDVIILSRVVISKIDYPHQCLGVKDLVVQVLLRHVHSVGLHNLIQDELVVVLVLEGVHRSVEIQAGDWDEFSIVGSSKEICHFVSSYRRNS